MSIIRFILTGDTSGLDKAADGAKKQLSQLKSEFRSGVTVSAKWGAAMAAAGAAITAHLVNKSAEAAKEMQNLARLSNTTVKEFSRQAYAAKTVGIETGKLADIYKDMQDRVGDFISTGGGPMLDFFENIGPKVGITAKEFQNLSGPQALQLYVDSLQKANISQNEMTFYMEAIASDSALLLPLLRDNGRAMGELGDQADRLGVSLSDVDAAALSEMKASISQVTAAVSGVVNKFSAELAPVITAINRQFIETAEAGGKLAEAPTRAFNLVIKGAAFTMDAIEGVKRTFQVTGQAIAVVVLKIKKDILGIAETIVNGPIRQLNKLIEAVNNIPGDLVELPELQVPDIGQELYDSFVIADRAVTNGWEDIKATLAEPLPGGQFLKFVEEAKAAGEESAEAIVAAQNAARESVSAGGASGPNADQTKEIEQRLNALRESYQTELQDLQAKFGEEQEILNEAREAKLISQMEFDARLLEVERNYQDQATELERRGAEARKKVSDAENRAKMAMAKNVLGQLSTLMNSESRKTFEIGKAAAIANATISTFTGMTKALEWGWPLGPIFAAGIGLAGFANVQSIRSQSFGGGGAPATTSNTQAVNSASTPAVPTNDQQGGGGGTTFHLAGIERGSLYEGGMLLDIINNELANGGTLGSVS